MVSRYLLLSNPLFKLTSGEHVAEFLEAQGWQRAETHRWILYRGSEDRSGQPLEIALPRDTSLPDYRLYVARAVDTISMLAEEDPDRILLRILYFDRDILGITNPDAERSIPLDLAAQQLDELRTLVRYAASSELDQRPFFVAASGGSKKAVEHYHFGHTFIGSFGLRIESVVSRQMPLWDGITDFYRRIMERIVRGLLIVRQAQQESSIEIVLNSYSRALNANMCEALAKMETPLAYSVIWSERQEPAEDVQISDPIHIDSRHHALLREAAEGLRAREPEVRKIQGLITGLETTDNPESRSAKRAIRIRWSSRPSGYPESVDVELERDDYVRAIDAHRRWATVELEAQLEWDGRKWRLVSPRNFRVLN